MSYEPIEVAQVLTLLGHMRAGRRDPDCPLLKLAIVSRECGRRHLADSVDGRWLALTEMLSEFILNKAAESLGMSPQQLRVIAEQGGADLFELLRRCYNGYSSQPACLAWLYLFVRYIAPRLQHQELERRVRGKDAAADSNAFWNTLKNKTAGPLLTRALNRLEGDERERLGPQAVASASLPAPDTALVGRVRTKQRALDAIRGDAMVTLTGQGGIGKTSLALHLAWELAPRFPDGVHWLELSRVTNPEQLPAWLWQALGQGRPMPPDPAAGLAGLLRDRRMLLVLDNCEHLLPPIAALVERLLQAGPELRILATSRRPLKLGPERVLRLRGLAVPPEDAKDDLGGYEAVRAFAQEAERHNPAFELSAVTAPLVAAIVRRVDGLPLALKLIAPWTRHLSLSEILGKLDELLQRGADQDRGVAERHRTLSACLDWSVDRLDAGQREVFTQLAVFRGGWTTGAVAAVCLPSSGPLDEISSIEMLLRLVDFSLIEVESGGAQSRGRLLEPIRGLCLKRLDALGAGEALRERHAAYYLALAERAEADRATLGEQTWLAALDDELPNLRQAAGWARSTGRLELALRLATVTWRHGERRGSGAAAMADLDWGLEHPAFADLPREARARALNAAGSLALRMALDERAERCLTAAAELLHDHGPPRLLMKVLHNLGSLRMSVGDLDGAHRSFEAALALAEPGDEAFRAGTECNLAILSLDREGPSSALDWLDRSESYYLGVGDQYGLALCLSVRGQSEVRLGRLALARRALADAAELFRQAGDARRELETLNFLASAALHDLDISAAGIALDQAAAVEARADDPAHAINLARLQARRDLLDGDAEGAAEHLRRLRIAIGPSIDPVFVFLIDIEHAWALAAMGLQREAALRAACAVSFNSQHHSDAHYTLAALEAWAVTTDDERGPCWLAELSRIRARAGLPRTALQAARCGEAATPAVAGQAKDGAGDWRADLNKLATEMEAAACLG